MSKNIVIISFATYPRNTPRDFRTDELAKELARQGNSVILYVLKGNYDYICYEKKTGIKVKDLGKTYFFDFKHNVGIVEPLWGKILRKIIGRYLQLPFIELIRNTYSALSKEKDKSIDLLITIAIPYQIHWGAALYKYLNKTNFNIKKWVADCGDPFMGNSFDKKPFYFKYLEKFFCRQVDYLSIPLKDAKYGYYQEFHNKIKVIPQGFNFEEIKINMNYVKNSVPTFIYAGTFYNELRDPRPLIDFLIKLDIDFKFIIFTKDKIFLEKYRDFLGKKLFLYDYIPRKDLIYKMSSMDFLINLENPNSVQSPSKLIDYALSGRPIMSINTGSGIDESKVLDFLNGNYTSKLEINNIEQYNIKNIANDFLSLLD